MLAERVFSTTYVFAMRIYRIRFTGPSAIILLFCGRYSRDDVFRLREKFHQQQLTPRTSETAFEEKLQIHRVGKKRSLEFALHPWIDSGLIKLGVWLWASSLIWRE